MFLLFWKGIKLHHSQKIKRKTSLLCSGDNFVLRGSVHLLLNNVPLHRSQSYRQGFWMKELEQICALLALKLEKRGLITDYSFLKAISKNEVISPKLSQWWPNLQVQLANWQSEVPEDIHLEKVFLFHVFSHVSMWLTLLWEPAPSKVCGWY